MANTKFTWRPSADQGARILWVRDRGKIVYGLKNWYEQGVNICIIYRP